MHHDSAAAAAAGLLASFGLIGFSIGFAAFVISVIANWKIVAKAGYSGVLCHS